jgi:3-mercaptopyruvate sulfurtransferase SseA
VRGVHRQPRGDGRFLPAEQLKQRFAAKLGGRSPEQLVAYCGSGVTACHNLFALALAGYPLGAVCRVVERVDQRSAAWGGDWRLS